MHKVQIYYFYFLFFFSVDCFATRADLLPIGDITLPKSLALTLGVFVLGVEALDFIFFFPGVLGGSPSSFASVLIIFNGALTIALALGFPIMAANTNRPTYGISRSKMNDTNVTNELDKDTSHWRFLTAEGSK